MADYCIMTDSCCDLDGDLARELDLCVLPLSVNMGGKTYYNWLDGRDIGFHAFYDRIREGTMPTTSAVSAGQYETAMRNILEGGQDVLCLAFSSGLSATYQSAEIAAEHLRKEFPGRQIEVVDTLSASGGQGLMVWLCVQEKRKGKTLTELTAYANEIRHHICHWFTVDDLNHLKRGGRINAATALFGTMLSIKPILHVDEKGCLVSMDKTRGRKAAIQALIDRMARTAEHPADQTVFITHGDCLEDAEYLAAEVRRQLKVRDTKISYVGPVIGSHTGPGVLALMFVGSPR